MKKKISAGAFAALLAFTLVPAAVAHADTDDDDFSNFVAGHGIHLGTPAQTVNMARTMCNDLGQGYSQKDEVDQLTGSGKLSQTQAEFFIGAATGTYCPGKHSGNKPAGG